ncbi:MAG: helix-turn-helix domain-containing protein [Planctomycetota bacterium]
MSPRKQVLRMVRRGRRLKDIARELLMPYQYVQAIAADSGEVYAGRQLDDEQRSEIERRRVDEGESIRSIASAMGLPKSKVGRYARRRFLEVEREGQDDGVEFVDASTKSEIRRCPKHGRVSVWPCVACAALEAIDH